MWFTRAVVDAILFAWSAWIGYPLYWLFAAALRRLPDSPTFTLAFTNSVFVSVGSACIALVLGAMAGYGLARFSYRIGPLTNDKIRLGFLARRLFPVAVLSVPYLLMFRQLDSLRSERLRADSALALSVRASLDTLCPRVSDWTHWG